jgi:CHC2 zinc finger
MCSLPRESGPDSDSGLDGEDRIVDGSDENRNAFPPPDQNREQRLLRIANKKRKLSDVLQEYGIAIVRAGSWDSWSVSVRCPFPTHKGGNERTASFAYSFSKDIFHCFGCGLAGGTCDFIAHMEGTDRLAVAEQIITDAGGYELDEDVEGASEGYDDELFRLAGRICDEMQRNKNNPKQLRRIERAVHLFDSFVCSEVPKQKILVEDMLSRIQRCRDHLDEAKELEDE